MVWYLNKIGIRTYMITCTLVDLKTPTAEHNTTVPPITSINDVCLSFRNYTISNNVLLITISLMITRSNTGY